MVKTSKVRTKRKPSAKKPTKKPIEDLIDFIEDGDTIDLPERLLDHCFLIYGESGIGKTSLASKIPGAYIVQCDPNRRGLKVRQTNIPSHTIEDLKKDRTLHTPWSYIEAVVEKCLEDDSVECIVIDNFGNFYNYAYDHICWGKDIDNAVEANDYGVTWNEIDALYHQLIMKINESGRGVVLVAHEKVKEVESIDDSTYERIEPEVTGRAFKWIRACTNFAFYMCFHESGSRQIILRSDKYTWTKCCTDEDEPRFYFNGQPIKAISAGQSPNEGWDNLMKSWDNKLADINHKPEKKKIPKKRSSKS